MRQRTAPSISQWEARAFHHAMPLRVRTDPFFLFSSRFRVIHHPPAQGPQDFGSREARGLGLRGGTCLHEIWSGPMHMQVTQDHEDEVRARRYLWRASLRLLHIYANPLLRRSRHRSQSSHVQHLDGQRDDVTTSRHDDIYGRVALASDKLTRRYVDLIVP